MASQVPVSIPHRPYGICPPTNLMNTDGFFVVNMGSQYIEAQITNAGAAALQNVRVYIEGISDPGVVLTPSVANVGSVPLGASFPVRFLANFHSAAPGIALVSFIVEANGFTFRRTLKKVFVTRVDYHKPSRTYSVVMPQGTMRVRFRKAIMGPGGVQCPEKRRKAFVVLPSEVSYEWVPTPPYAGTHGPFPYEDPWWKLALAILAALLALGGLLYDYFSDGDLDGGSVSVSGTFDETDQSVTCCSSVSTSAADSDDWIARGLYGGAGGAATAAIASDGPDLHYRGQEATPPGAGELTLSEQVRLKIEYVEPPNLGRRFRIAGKWDYARTTTSKTYNHQAADKRENLHWLKSYEIQVPTVHDRMSGPLIVAGRFQQPSGKYYKGNGLYVSAVLVAPDRSTRQFNLSDHGLSFDKKADDGWYTGGYHFVSAFHSLLTHMVKEDPAGDYYLFVFAQDVNTVLQGTAPFKAAHTIGGFILTPQLELNFNGPCRLTHDAVIHVV